MEKETFNITINATREKVWNSLWEDANYRQWTAAFTEGSRAETDWKEGSKVLFLDAKNDGLVSIIAKKIPHEFMSFQHIGSVIKGVESTDRPEDKAWAGSTENYTLKTNGSATELTVDLQTKGLPENMVDYFKVTWPKALETLKEVAEKNN